MGITTYSGSSGSSTPTTSAGTDGTFPQGSSIEAQYAAAGQELAQYNSDPAAFFAAYKVSSTEQPFYQTKGVLNNNAAYLIWYNSIDQAERQSIQDQMSQMGLMSPTDANGYVNSTATTAFTDLLTNMSSQGGTDPVTFLNKNAGGTTGIQNQISANLTKAQENATQPIVATVENPTTLSADITAAFETALGYSPDQAQISSFINQVQGQDTTYAEAPRTEAQQQINQAHSEESALNKLGPDGIDSVIQAYQAAVSGQKLPGTLSAVQGPQLSQGQSTAPVMSAPGTTAPTSTPISMNLPSDLPTPNIPGATVTSKQVTAPEGAVGQAVNLFSKSLTTPFARTSPPTTTDTVRTLHGEKAGTEKVGSTEQLAPTHFNPGQSPTYGGLYALSQADWQEATKLLPNLIKKQMTSPGVAPASVQQAALNALLTNAYESNGNSWSKAVSEIASGTPFGTSEGTHLSAFGDQVASEVNSQITQLQDQVNNDTVTTKVSAPDAVAEADLAAKQSDPTGYYAAQDASWGSVLNKMLSGTPDMYDQTSSDTYTGPVAEEAETTPASAGAV